MIASGHPRSKACGESDSTAVPTTAAEPLAFENGSYAYTWKTDKAWRGQCRELIVKLADNTVRRATFRFKA